MSESACLCVCLCDAEQEANRAGRKDTGHPDADAWLPYRRGTGGAEPKQECPHEHLTQDTVTTTQHSTSSRNSDDNDNFPEGSQSKKSAEYSPAQLDPLLN